MTIALKNFVYADAGTAVSGATVNAVRTTDSVTVSSTSTDANGMWTFSLADVASGYYDVQVVNGQQQRWQKGSVKIQCDTLSVSGGGIYVQTGGVQVAAGGIGVGIGPQSQAGVWVGGTINAAGALADAYHTNATLVAQANNDTLAGAYINPTFNDNGKTGVVHLGGWFNGPLILAGATPTAGVGQLGIGNTTSSGNNGAAPTMPLLKGTGTGPAGASSGWIALSNAGTTIWVPFLT